MLFIYYNPNYNTFYTKIVKSCYFNPIYEVGYVNQFEHILVSMYLIGEKELINCKSLADYSKTKKKKMQDKSLRNVLIDRIICVLNKIKE